MGKLTEAAAHVPEQEDGHETERQCSKTPVEHKFACGEVRNVDKMHRVFQGCHIESLRLAITYNLRSMRYH